MSRFFDALARHAAIKVRTGRGQSMIETLERRMLLSSALPFFQPALITPVPPGAGTFAVADVNGDGRLDFVANGTGNTCATLLGNGDGTFQSPVTFVGAHGFAIVAADLNNDGRMDLVMDDESKLHIVTLLGNGDGTFQAPQTVGGGVLETALATVDVNVDGHADIIVGAGRDGLDVILGNGDGTFQPRQKYVALGEIFGIGVADLNGDGKPDIAGAAFNSPTTSIFLNNGNGTFAPQQTLSTGGSPYAVQAADLNGDGRQDLVVGSAAGSASTLGVFPGNGDGTFAPQVTFAGLAGEYSLTLADINGDGRTDAVERNKSGAVAIFPGNGDGTFGAPMTLTAGNFGFVSVADINRDGRPDITALGTAGATVLLADLPPTVLSITAPAISNTFVQYESDPTIDYVVTFSEPVNGVDPTDFQVVTADTVTANPVVAVSGGPTVYTVTVSDITGGQPFDGGQAPGTTIGLNLVSDGSIRDQVGQPLAARGGVAFVPARTFTTPTGYSQITAADINGDGKIDIAWTNYNAANMSVALGNGDGTFGPQRTFAAGTHALSVIAVDANRDGRMDLVVCNQGDNNLGILLGNGDGTFGPQTAFATGNSPWSVVTADVNRDGIPDLLAANQNSNTVSVLLGNGDGSFKAQLTNTTVAKPTAIAPADLNGDGRPDLIVANGNGVTVLLGNGDGTFHAGVTTSLGVQVSALFTGDVNSDGKTDLIAGRNVLLGNGDGTFGPQMTSGVAGPGFSGSGFSAIADMNGDGKLDAITTFGTGGAVALGNGDGTFTTTTATQLFPLPTFGSVTVADFNHDGHPDLIFAQTLHSGVAAALLANPTLFVGRVYNVIPRTNDIAISIWDRGIGLSVNPDGLHLDFTNPRSFPVGQMLINDPAGLTIKGDGQLDNIALSYLHGNPLPHLVRLDGGQFDFVSFNAPASGFLAGTTLDILHSTVSFWYGSDPEFATAVPLALKQGYNGGAWNGLATDTTGAIVSSNAASGPAGMFGIGIADLADGIVTGQTSNTMEIRYTLMGDANLDGKVDGTDALLLGRHLPSSGSPTWDAGNFNYDSTIDLNDAAILRKNWNAVLTATTAPAAAPTNDLSSASTSAAVEQSVVATTADSAPLATTPVVDQGHVQLPYVSSTTTPVSPAFVAPTPVTATEPSRQENSTATASGSIEPPSQPVTLEATTVSDSDTVQKSVSAPRPGPAVANVVESASADSGLGKHSIAAPPAHAPSPHQLSLSVGLLSPGDSNSLPMTKHEKQKRDKHPGIK